MTTPSAYPATQVVAQFAATAQLGDAAPALRERAVRAFVDTVASAIAGRTESSTVIGHRVVAEQLRPGRATVLATGAKVPAQTAAFLNGLSGHVHDYDDMTDPLVGHPSVALFPALLAVGQDVGVSGVQFLDAYVVGYQTAIAIDRALDVGAHFRRGWHSTSTVGVLAATVAVGRLLGSSEDQLRHSLGIAASTASGSRLNFGTATKSLHAALLAQDAVLAARLAAGGFTGNPSQLESAGGYFDVFGGPAADPTQLGRALNGPWALLSELDRIYVKPYPSCGATHRPMEAGFKLAERLRGRLGEIHEVRVTAPVNGYVPLIQHRPTSSLEGKFSAEYAVSAALIDGTAGLSTFTDVSVQRPEAQALLRKVSLHESALPPFGGAYLGTGYATVEVVLPGETLRARVDRVPELPDEREALSGKLRECLSFAALPWDPEAVLGELWSIGERPSLGAFGSFAPERPLVVSAVA